VIALSDPIPMAPADEPTPPLHERWPQILAYAMQTAALTSIVAIGVAHLVTILPFGFLLDVAVWAAFFQYAFEVLRWSANGRSDAPEFPLTVGEGVARYAVLLMVLVNVSITLLILFVSPVMALLFGVLMMFAMPAIMMILALEEGVERALNPVAWLLIATRIGRTYFVLVGFFCAALVVQSVIAGWLAQLLPNFLALTFSGIAINYLMVTNFHLIGTAIYTHRTVLGYSGHLQFHDEPRGDAARAIIDSARHAAAEGDARGAADLLREEIKGHPHMTALHDEYRHWLQELGSKAELAQHGRSYVPILLAQDRDRRAVEVARECQMIDPAFTLDKAEDLTRLAHDVAESGHAQLALSLLAGFHKRFRNHPDIGRNYLLAAKLLAEKMNKEMQARAMLNQIKVTLPNDPIIPQVDSYIAYLDKLAATPARSTS
jgi:hypothetical protein